MDVYSTDRITEFDFAEADCEAAVTGYHGGLDHLIIPSEIGGKAVTRVGGSFDGVLGVRLPDSVRSIDIKLLRKLRELSISDENPHFLMENGILYSRDMKTLFYCFDKGIYKFKIPDPVEIIGEYAFCGCENIRFGKRFFPKGLKSIGARAFHGCRDILNHVTVLPETLEDVGLEAFAPEMFSRDSDISDDISSICEREVIYPKTLKTIKGYAKYFGRIDFDHAIYMRAENGVVITADGKTAIGYCGGFSARTLVIPDSVEIIDEFAFYRLKKLNRVFWGNDLREIRKMAFPFCGISELRITEKLELIGEDAFPLQALNSVIIDGNNRFFRADGVCLFCGKELLVCYNTGIEEYFVPDGIETIRDGAFEKCRDLSDLVLPKSLRRFSGLILPGCSSRNAFCQLTEIEIPEDIEDFADESINGISLRFSDNAKTVFQRGGVLYKRIGGGLAAIGFLNDRDSADVLDGTFVIAENAFAGCDNLRSVSLPDTLKRIEAGAFSGSGLQSAVLPERLEYIGENAFEDCALGKVFIPESVKHIDLLAFGKGVEYFEVSPDNRFYSSENGALYSKDKTILLRVPVSFRRRKFSVPEGVYEVRGAFSACENITKIVLPESLKIVRGGAFGKMKYAPAVVVKGRNTFISEYDAAPPPEYTLIGESGSEAERFFLEQKKLAAKKMLPCKIKFRTARLRAAYKQTCGFEVTFCGSEAAVCGTDSKTRSLVIPEKISGYAVTRIAPYAFANYNWLQTVSIADTVERIGKGAFYGCGNLSGITLPAMLRKVPKEMLRSCCSLKRCIIPEGCRSIGAGAFKYCHDLAVLGIPASVQKIASDIFGKRTTRYPTIYVVRNSFADSYFARYGKKRGSPRIVYVNSMADIPPETKSGIVGDYLYDTDPVRGVTISFREACRSVSDKKEYHIPKTVCGHPVTAVNTFNFTNVKSLYIPASVEEIRMGLNRPERIYVAPENKKYFSDGQALYTKDGSELILFCDRFAKSYTVLPGTRKIAHEAFKNMGELTEVILPEGLEEIGDDAFNECFNIRAAAIPDSVRVIGVNAFYCGYISNLREVNIPLSLEVINNGAFDLDECDLFVPKNVRRIEPGGFGVFSRITVCEENPFYSSMDGCLYNKDKTKLLKYYDDPAREEFVVPKTVTAIGKSAFAFARNLRRVILGKNVVKIGDSAFYGASELKYIDLKYVKTIKGAAFAESGIVSAELHCGTIPSSAFARCESLAGVKLVGTEKISVGAFAICSSLERVTLPETLRSIGSLAFENCVSLKRLLIPKSVTEIGKDAFWEIGGIEIYDSFKPSFASLVCADENRFDKLPRIAVRSAQTDDILFVLPVMSKRENDEFFDTMLNCWGEYGSFDFCELDNCFPYENTYSDALAGVALCRVVQQNALLPKHKALYVEWLKRYATEAVCCIIDTGDHEMLSALEKLGVIRCADREKTLDHALSSGKTDFTALLLEISVPRGADIPELSDFDGAADWRVSDITPTKAAGYPFMLPDAVFPEEIGGTRITGVASRCGKPPENYAAITSLTIPEGYTSIGANAFLGCRNLRSVTLPSTLKTIGSYAFASCPCLEEVLIPDGVLSIGEGAFMACEGLEKIKLPAALVQIGENAFDELPEESVPEELKWVLYCI